MPGGLDWYRLHFPQSGALTIEASPYYLFRPLALQRVSQDVPGVKVIVLNPVDRAISHYFHEARNGNEDLPIDEALARESERLAGEQTRLLSDASYHSFKLATLFLQGERDLLDSAGTSV
jgi:hypothetical protein